MTGVFVCCYGTERNFVFLCKSPLYSHKQALIIQRNWNGYKIVERRWVIDARRPEMNQTFSI